MIEGPIVFGVRWVPGPNGFPGELLPAGRWLCVSDYFAPNLYAVFFGSKSASVKPLLVFTFM